MINRTAYILRSSQNGKRHICIDSINEHEILSFLQGKEARVKKFNLAVDLILRNIKNAEIYGKEEISAKAKGVTAIKMFKGGENIRLYCKEQSNSNGTFFVIICELLPKKKDQKVKAKIKSIIERVGSYEYTIIERSKE